MGDARCSCGAVTLSFPEKPSRIVVACHCIDCQRRTGAPFGVGAYYPAELVNPQLFGCHHPNTATQRHATRAMICMPICIQYWTGVASR